MNNEFIPILNSSTSAAAKGHAVMYLRDSGGKHETTPGPYVEWAQRISHELNLSFAGTPACIKEMIRTGQVASNNLFLDWNVSGRNLDRPGLNSLLKAFDSDPTITHLLVPRPDRLFRPNEGEDGTKLERKIRQHYGKYLVFTHRVMPPIRIGERMTISDLITSTVEFQQAGEFRRELAGKTLSSQLSLAASGHSTGGRAKYGFERWLVGPDKKPIRCLEDGEYIRRSGHHVVWIPKADETFQIRCRIKRDLFTMPASQIARQLNLEGIPTPDSGRMRDGRGVSGIWHATTITNIGRDPIDAGIIRYGLRSMGDQLRFSLEGPRELTEADFTENNEPKVINNPESSHITAPAAVPGSMSKEDQDHLTEILDKRAGTQRHKPRSRSPEQNPLGVRVFDMNCSWPMYRAPYQDTFRHVCGLYQQSSGAHCHHNHINGPSAVKLVVSMIHQRLYFRGGMEPLRQRIREIAANEASKNDQPRQRAAKEGELQHVRSELRKVERNLALADTEEKHRAISRVFDELQAKEELLRLELDQIQKPDARGINEEEAVERALEVLNDLQASTSDPSDFRGASKLINAVNARLFIRFRGALRGKREVRIPESGILTLGTKESPIELYQGPTSRASLKKE